MRRTPYLLLMTLLLVGMTLLSCSREDPEEEEKEEQEDKKVEDWENEDIDGDATMAPRVMQFNVGHLTTRAITPFNGVDYSFSVGDRISIEMTRGDEVVGPKVYKVSNTDGDLEFDYDYAPTGQPFYLENKNDFQLRAWSYGNSTAVPDDPVGSSFTLNTDQRTATTRENYKELLYSPKQTYSYSSNKIPIRLYHQLARLKITLTHEAAGDLSVNYVQIGNSSIPTTANFSETGINVTGSVFTGSWTDHSSTKTQVYARADAANQNYTVVLFPNTSLSGKLINVVTTDSKTYAYTLPSSVTFNSGNQYNYTITVKDEIFFNDVTTDHYGWYVNTDGTVTKTKNERGKSSVARISYVRKPSDPSALNSYFSKFIAIALEDISESAGSWTRMVVDANTWASSTSKRTVYDGTTYSGCSNGTSSYDNSYYFTGGTNWIVYTGNIKRGWRVPTITDWNYLLDGICDMTVTYGTTAATFNVKYVTPSTILSAINVFCQGSDGTTSPSFMVYSVYTVGTEPDSDNGWVINLTSSAGNWGWNVKRNYDANDSRRCRLVFAF